MVETITAREANHSFSRILAGVQEGKEYVVTLHGKPVAKISPTADIERPRSRELTPDQEQALAELFAILRTAQPGEPGKMTREEMHERHWPSEV